LLDNPGQKIDIRARQARDAWLIAVWSPVAASIEVFDFRDRKRAHVHLRCSSSTEIVSVGRAAAAPTVEKIFGLTMPAVAIATSITTTVRAVSSFIIEHLCLSV
jgi:hypothetical protein